MLTIDKIVAVLEARCERLKAALHATETYMTREMMETIIDLAHLYDEHTHTRETMGKMKTLSIKRLNDDTANRCPQHASGLHEPDLFSVHRDHQAPSGVVDLTCVHCGRSGAVRIAPEEVDW